MKQEHETSARLSLPDALLTSDLTNVLVHLFRTAQLRPLARRLQVQRYHAGLRRDELGPQETYRSEPLTTIRKLLDEIEDALGVVLDEQATEKLLEANPQLSPDRAVFCEVELRQPDDIQAFLQALGWQIEMTKGRWSNKKPSQNTPTALREQYRKLRKNIARGKQPFTIRVPICAFVDLEIEAEFTSRSARKPQRLVSRIKPTKAFYSRLDVTSTRSRIESQQRVMRVIEAISPDSCLLQETLDNMLGQLATTPEDRWDEVVFDADLMPLGDKTEVAEVYRAALQMGYTNSEHTLLRKGPWEVAFLLSSEGWVVSLRIDKANILQIMADKEAAAIHQALDILLAEANHAQPLLFSLADSPADAGIVFPPLSAQVEQPANLDSPMFRDKLHQELVKQLPTEARLVFERLQSGLAKPGFKPKTSDLYLQQEAQFTQVWQAVLQLNSQGPLSYQIRTWRIKAKA